MRAQINALVLDVHFLSCDGMSVWACNVSCMLVRPRIHVARVDILYMYFEAIIVYIHIS